MSTLLAFEHGSYCAAQFIVSPSPLRILADFVANDTGSARRSAIAKKAVRKWLGRGAQVARPERTSKMLGKEGFRRIPSLHFGQAEKLSQSEIGACAVMQ